MKKLILAIFICFYSSIVLSAGPAPDSKDTASKGVKASTKFDVGKKLVSKAKKLEKKK